MKIPKIMTACVFLLMQNVVMGMELAAITLTPEVINLLKNDAGQLREFAQAPLGEDCLSAIGILAENFKAAIENNIAKESITKEIITIESINYAQGLVEGVYSESTRLFEEGAYLDLFRHGKMYPFCLKGRARMDELISRAIVLYSTPESNIPEINRKIKQLMEINVQNEEEKRALKHKYARLVVDKAATELLQSFIQDKNDKDYKGTDEKDIYAYCKFNTNVGIIKKLMAMVTSLSTSV